MVLRFSAMKSIGSREVQRIVNADIDCMVLKILRYNKIMEIFK